MKIPVDRLTATPAPFAFRAGSDWWRAQLRPDRGLPESLLEPFRIDVRAHRMNDDLYLEGSVSGALELECSRCLARYRHALCERFRLVLEPAGARRPADPEAAQALARDGLCLGDDPEVGTYRGNELRLDALALEVVALALPVQPLCREDCAGLCPQCGAERSLTRCDCAEATPESPFAVLAALRDGLVRGGS